MDLWADQVGDTSYTWKNVLPYYQKSPYYTPPPPGLYTNASYDQDPSAYSTAGGPLQITSGHYVDAFSTFAQRVFPKLGLSRIAGLNSGKNIGSAWGTYTLDPTTQRRSSSESSFLQSAFQNTSLRVYKQTLAEKILFSSNRTANGVLVTTAGTYGVPSVQYTLSATREVIVSAGAFQSPQLLMVSGIGPQHTLEAHNIPVVQGLPGVGQNLWDQPRFGISYRVNVLTVSAFSNIPQYFNQAFNDFYTKANGALTRAGGYVGFEKLPTPYRNNLTNQTLSRLSEFPADWPEIEWLATASYNGLSRNYQTEDPRDGYNYATLANVLVAPLSKGSVTIRSASMSDPPVINPNYLTDKGDIELAIASFKRIRQAWNIFSAYNLTIGEEYFPGPSVQSDTEILKYLQEAVIHIYHASATCKMGKASDPMAVIDSQAQVFGVKGLRVVDASSFPFLPPGHPQSTVYMLAEKIAADILVGK